MAKKTESKQYHSLIFRKRSLNENTETNSWDTWRLIPASRPVIIQPQPTYKYIDIPGQSGQIDLSTYLTGNLVYGNRTGSLDFFVYRDNSEEGSRKWEDRRNRLAKYFDGSEFYVILEDDPNSFYIGRLFLANWQPGPQWSSVSISYNFKPYRYYVSNAKNGYRQYSPDTKVGL